MKFDELLYKRFVECEGITSKMAQYDKKPAIFSGDPPTEEQSGWDSRSQYPMLIYNYDMQANEERNSIGTLSVSLLCQDTSESAPEDIEKCVRECLKDVAMMSDDGTPYCFAWNRTDAFTVDNKNISQNDIGLVIGCETRFDILEYPFMETSDPDPVVALAKHIKEMYPSCRLLGIDEFEGIVEATIESPLVYCRIISSELDEETNTVAWLNGRLSVHILCPDSQIRNKMAADITNQISLAGEVIMLDSSPMFIKRIQVNYKSDYLKDGQISLTGRYGLLRYKAKAPTLNNIGIRVGGI